MAVADAIEAVDLAVTPLRDLNLRLHAKDAAPRWRVAHPSGAHAVAVGIDAEIEVDVDGHVGYYCAGMNKRATVRVHGNAGVGLAENIMSGTVVVDGYAGQSCAASGRGGLVVVRGDASARCGISMKGVRIVVEGSVGHMSAFMAQKGALESCLTDLDGFYTFAVGTADGFAVLRDPIACKPAVLAETDDWVAMASEYRAIAVLPGAAEARMWEPEPGRVYSWERAKV